MSEFYIQSGYTGKEVGSLLFSYDKECFKYSKIHDYDGEVLVGSVEFVESFIGPRKPIYYPEFLSDYFNRNIWRSETWPTGKCFVKPADRHKRFESAIVSYNEYPQGFGGGTPTGMHVGPYWCSEIVNFIEEWRYYIKDGKCVDALWYAGNEKEVKAPRKAIIDIDWPKGFCGAVDFGRLDTGEFALVENNLPYACGWYGPYSDGKIYGEWLKAGFKYIK
jgi:hypothetical protein